MAGTHASSASRLNMLQLPVYGLTVTNEVRIKLEKENYKDCVDEYRILRVPPTEAPVTIPRMAGKGEATEARLPPR
jgi:hypothetical protein